MSSGSGPNPNSSDDEGSSSEKKDLSPSIPAARKPRAALAVEKEIGRLDKFLRWSVIALAFFLACTEISNTETLLHIKCGEYTASNLQPARLGIFSYAAESRPWANLSWLFDLILFSVYAGGSDIAVSIFQAALAATIVSLIVSCRISGVSTWWNVICAMLFAIACAPQWNALPEIVTFLGLGLILRLLLSWSETGSRKPLWFMLPVFLFWCNLDPRVYLGLTLLLLFALGEFLGSLVNHPRAHQIKSQIPLWLAFAGSTTACLLNPFGWDSLVYPYQLYTVIDPTMTVYLTEIISERDIFHFTMMNYSIWNIAGWSFAASMLLIVITLISLFLNRKKVRPGEWFSLLGFLGLALIAIRELPPSTFVACLLGIKAAQQWYLDYFRQTFSLRKSEFFFSRGGRLLTAMTIFLMGVLALAGHLGNEKHRIVGIGFSPEIEEEIAELKNILADSFDDRPFNFRRRQGDLLIWLDRKAFLDSRCSLYASNRDENLLFTHARMKSAILGSARSNTQREDWQRQLEHFRIYHVLVGMDSRTTESRSAFRSYLALRGSFDWQLVNLSPSVAVFYRTDLQIVKLSNYRKARQIDFIESAFKSRYAPIDVSRLWNPPQTKLQKFFAGRYIPMALDTQLAQHYYLQLQVVDEGRFPSQQLDDMSLAFAYLTIRHADRGLSKQTLDPVGFYFLGNTFGYLKEVEQKVGVLDTRYLDFMTEEKKRISTELIGSFSLRRYYQSVHSLRQSLKADLHFRPSLYSLTFLFNQNKKWDLAARAGTELIEKSIEDRENESLKKYLINIEEEIAQAKSRVRLELDTATQSEKIKPTALEEAKVWYREGMILRAIQILEQSSKDSFNNRDAIDVSLFLAKLYLESGWSQKTAKILETVQLQESKVGSVKKSNLSQWRNLNAYVRLLNAEYAEAASLWRKNHAEFRNLQIELAVSALFFYMRPYEWIKFDWPTWQTEKIHRSKNAMLDMSFRASFYLFQASLCSLEQGDVNRARAEFQSILKTEPETPFRKLIEKYLRLLQSRKRERPK